MSPFVERMYGSFNLDIIESCAERLNDLRNAFAHGNTDYSILPEHTLDLRLTERLLYPMILSDVGIDNSTAVSIISSIT